MCGAQVGIKLYQLQTGLIGHCIDVGDARSTLHCAIKAYISDKYNFALTFRQGVCSICRSQNTDPDPSRNEQLMTGSFYTTGNAITIVSRLWFIEIGVRLYNVTYGSIVMCHRSNFTNSLRPSDAYITHS